MIGGVSEMHSLGMAQNKQCLHSQVTLFLLHSHLRVKPTDLGRTASARINSKQSRTEFETGVRIIECQC